MFLLHLLSHGLAVHSSSPQHPEHSPIGATGLQRAGLGSAAAGEDDECVSGSGLRGVTQEQTGGRSELENNSSLQHP